MKVNKYTLEKAIATFGVDAQVKKALEESIELSHALVKFLKHPTTDNRNNLIDEIADITIMNEQLNMMFDFESEVQERIDFKLERLKSIMVENNNVDSKVHIVPTITNEAKF